MPIHVVLAEAQSAVLCDIATHNVMATSQTKVSNRFTFIGPTQNPFAFPVAVHIGLICHDTSRGLRRRLSHGQDPNRRPAKSFRLPRWPHSQTYLRRKFMPPAATPHAPYSIAGFVQSSAIDFGSSICRASPDRTICLPARSALHSACSKTRSSPREDAAKYIQELPKAEQEVDEWQTAIEAMHLVVDNNGPTMMARIGVMRR
jgi:hypothetical protein